jgi:hypothetical protein
VAAPELSESEAKFLRGLALRNVRFLVVGLSAAALQGAPVVTQDVDLWFEELTDARIREALGEVGASYVPPFQLNPPMFAGGGLELLDIVLHMHGLESFAKEYERRVEIAFGEINVPVLPLRRILASKRVTNRPKDRLVISALEDTMRANGEDPLRSE